MFLIDRAPTGNALPRQNLSHPTSKVLVHSGSGCQVTGLAVSVKNLSPEQLQSKTVQGYSTFCPANITSWKEGKNEARGATMVQYGAVIFLNLQNIPSTPLFDGAAELP